VRLPDPPLLVITDRQQARRPLLEIAEALFIGGVRWLSLREKDLPERERRDLLRGLVLLGERYRATISVHEDVESAAAVGARAVHLPDGASVSTARTRLGDVLVGLSAHDAAGLARAAAAGADYATLSPVFVSASKPGYGPALGLAVLDSAARAARLPVLALGGIDERTLVGVVAAGAAGAAVMGELMRADNPEVTAKRLVAALRASLAAR